MLIMQVRPAYSIPSSLEEFQQMFGNLCYEYGLDFCASPPKSEEEGNKRKEFTETEKQIQAAEIAQTNHKWQYTKIHWRITPCYSHRLRVDGIEHGEAGDLRIPECDDIPANDSGSPGESEPEDW